MVRRKRFRNEVERAVLERGDRHGDVAVAGHQQHRDLVVDRGDPAEEFQSVHFRHADVGNHGAVEPGVDAGQRDGRIALGDHRDAG
jgi:hypothetical protein